MKLNVLVYLNRIKVPYLSDFEKARQYHLKHGVDITWNFQNSDVHGYQSTLITIANGSNRYILTGSETLFPTPTADVTIFAFSQDEWASPAGSQYPLLQNTPTGDCFVYYKPFINLPLSPFALPGETWIMLAHELMHALAKKFQTADVMDTYIDNANPDSPTGNFAQQWSLLSKYINTMQTYKYFKPSEIVGLRPELVAKLDQARGIAGIPFRITSGLRSPSQNASVGGVANSSHLTGEAVDLACSDSQSRYKIVQAALQVAFNRVEVAQAHLHVDISKTLPQNVIVLSENS